MNGPKDTFFKTSFTLNLLGELVTLSEPKVMGILNVTPDSFYDGGKHLHNALSHSERLIQEGAWMIDIGGVSTRPGSMPVTTDEELKRVIPAIEELKKNFPETYISVDTYRGKVAQLAVEAGACLVNDVSAGKLDPSLLDVVAKLGVPYILMHMQGTPKNMQLNPSYSNVVQEVIYSLSKTLDTLRLKGIKDVIIDPGFGFGKSLEHNYELLKNLEYLHVLDTPLLVGVSRKRMIYNLLQTTPEQALNGTTAVHALALSKGAKLLRVHDVKAAIETITIYNAFENA